MTKQNDDLYYCLLGANCPGHCSPDGDCEVVTGAAVPSYVVIVLEKVIDERTAEHHTEAMTFSDACEKATEAANGLPSWIAITIVHAEDYPRFQENAERGENSDD